MPGSRPRVSRREGMGRDWGGDGAGGIRKRQPAPQCQALTKFVIRVSLKKMNVSLTPELENFVQTKVISGRYTSASEVVREALRLLEDQDQSRAAQLEVFRSGVDRRLASLDRGEGIDGEIAFAQIREKAALRRKKQA